MLREMVIMKNTKHIQRMGNASFPNHRNAGTATHRADDKMKQPPDFLPYNQYTVIPSG
jgi:hypothetical protein